MGTSPTARIRNVVLLGHTGTGKSTLVEAMLRAAGVVSGPIDSCRTVDTDPEEQDRGHSLGLAVASFSFADHDVTVLDTPGGAEFLGDVWPALAAADLAVLVVDAAAGLQPQHHELWDLCEEHDLPRLVFLNKCDLDRVRWDERIDELREVWGDRLAVVELPWDDDHGHLEGVLDVVHEVAIEEHDGIHRATALPDARRDRVDHDHEALVESVVEHDDDLLVRYLDGEVPTDAEVEGQLAVDIARGALVPVLCGAALHDVGVEPLLRFLVAEAPAPRPLADVDDSPVACVVKTFSDPYVGRISVLRVLAGVLTPDEELQVARTGASVRPHQLVRLCGRQQSPVAGPVPAGAVIAVAKLGDVSTGDVLAAPGADVEVEVTMPPMGHHRVVLEPRSTSDDAKLSAALDRVLQEDPSARLQVDLTTGARVMAFHGPTHADVTVERLERAHGITVDLAPAPIAYRETIRQPATGLGRHVKQSGGHGQYGIVTIAIHPRDRGEGFDFADETVGGVVPKQYVGAVEKGVLEAMGSGPLGGHPMVDIGVRLLDGKHHSVDSSDAAFRMAGILAFRAAVEEAAPVLLEPITAVVVRVPEDLTGTVLSDLASRRGRILGTMGGGDGWSVVEAHVPEVELATFAADLRSLTSGRGQVDMRPDHLDEVPDAVATRLTDTSTLAT